MKGLIVSREASLAPTSCSTRNCKGGWGGGGGGGRVAGSRQAALTSMKGLMMSREASLAPASCSTRNCKERGGGGGCRWLTGSTHIHEGLDAEQGGVTDTNELQYKELQRERGGGVPGG